MAKKPNYAKMFLKAVYWSLILGVLGAVGWLALEAYETYRNANL